MSDLRYLGGLFFALALVSNYAHAAPMLEIDSGGNVTGVTGLSVGMHTYNATFNDGSFEAVIFNDPTAVYSETFANAASSALGGFMLSQITSFEPDDIVGCTSVATCLVMTVFDFDSTGISVQGVYTRMFPDSVSGPFTTSQSAGINYADVTYATWQKVESVPEPSTVILMASGLIGLSLIRRKLMTQT